MNENIKKSIFPILMTVFSLILFLLVYLFINFNAVETYYFTGLIFAIPFVVFGTIMILSLKRLLKPIVMTITINVLIPVFAFSMLFCFGFLACKAATTVTTDISKYQRVLKVTGYPDNELVNDFPAQIPNNAKDIHFSYNPAFLQGGENLTLNFKADSETIKKYKSKFSMEAKWSGTYTDAKEMNNEVCFQSFDVTNYKNELPDDFIIYLLFSRPYQENNWNHGKICVVAINEQKNEIIFQIEDW